MRYFWLFLICFLVANGARGEELSCEKLLTGHPQILAIAREPAQRFLGELEGVLARNRDLAQDWQRLSEIERLVASDQHQAALAEFTSLLQHRSAVMAPSENHRGAEDRRELQRVLSKRVVAISGRIRSANDVAGKDAGGSGAPTGDPKCETPEPQAQSQDPSQPQSPPPNQNQTRQHLPPQVPPVQRGRQVGQDIVAPNPSQSPSASRSESEKSNGPEMASGNQPANEKAPAASHDEHEKANQQAQTAGESQRPSDQQSDAKSNPTSEPSGGGESQSGEGSKTGQNAQNGSSPQSSGKSGVGSPPQGGGGSSEGGQLPADGQAPSDGRASQGGESSAPGASQGRRDADPGTASKSGVKTGSASAPKDRQVNFRGGEPTRLDNSSGEENRMAQVPDGNGDTGKGGKSKGLKGDDLGGDEDSASEANGKTSGRSDKSRRKRGHRSQGTERSGLAPLAEGTELWRDFLRELGLSDKWRFNDDALFDQRSPRDLDRPTDNWRRRKTAGHWRESFNYLGEASTSQEIHRAQLDKALVHFLKNTLFAKVLRQAIAHPSQAQSLLRELYSLLGQQVKFLADQQVYVDDLNALAQQVFNLQEQITYLQLDFSDLRSLGTNITSYSAALSPRVINTLRALRLILNELGASLEEGERALLAEIDYTLIEVGASSPANAASPEDLGRLIWELIPGPLSRLTLENRFFQGRSPSTKDDFLLLGQKAIETTELDFFLAMIKVKPWVMVHMKEVDKARESAFPLDRRGPEDNDAQAFLLADDIAQWPQLVESPYGPDVTASLVEMGELTARQKALERMRRSPLRPKKKRSTVALADVSGSMARQEAVFAMRNLIIAVYLEQAFIPVAYFGDEFVFTLINFDKTAHAPIVVKDLPGAMALLRQIEVAPPGGGEDTLFNAAFVSAFEEIKQSLSGGAGGLNQASNIVLVTDGIDSSFAVEKLKADRTRILGENLPLRVDAFSIKDANKEFERLSELQGVEVEDSVPLTYLYLDSEKLQSHLGVKNLVHRGPSDRTPSGRLARDAAWTGFGAEDRESILEKMRARASAEARVTFARRSQLGRNLMGIANRRDRMSGHTLLDAPPPKWSDHLQHIENSDLRQHVSGRFGPIVKSMSQMLDARAQSEALGDLYEQLREIKK